MKRRLALTAVAASLALGTAACSNGDAEETAADAPAASSDSMTTESSESETSESATADTAAAGPVGPGCEAYAAANPTGAGSIDGMAEAKVSAAASGNPMLKTLVAAVSGQLNPDVNLVPTLDGGEFTVFAPVDDAFAKIPAATVEGLKTDGDTLTSILTYHVVEGRMSPDEISGTQTTVQGGTLEVAGDPEALTVNGANVICGGVQTENATVYLIDDVLMPTS